MTIRDRVARLMDEMLRSWPPDSGVLMDRNAGDGFASFIGINGIDHLVLHGSTTFANDERLLYGALTRQLKGGDIVGIVPMSVGR
jgi:hypothetical protein